MGRQKELALELSELARSILIHTGVAVYCDDHNYLRWEDDKGAENYAYALAANIVRRRQFRCDPVDLRNALAKEIRALHDFCPDCEEPQKRRFAASGRRARTRHSRLGEKRREYSHDR